MKKIYTFILSGLLCINAFVFKAQAPVPDLIHYKFNGTGTSVTNYASTPPVGAATATLMGALTQTGTIGCLGAVVGSGISSSTDYVNTGWVTSLPASWTISFWSSNVQPSTTLYYIFGDATAGSFRCFTNGVAGPNNWILRGTGITDITVLGAATTASNMVTFVYDQALANIVGYINGVATVTVAQGTPVISGTGPFKVIGYATNVGMNAGGLLGDFRVYSNALTPTDVLNVYNSAFITPTVSVSGINSICANESTTLTASGADTYTWSTASTNTAIIVAPSVTSSYTVTGGTGTCTNSAVSSITVNPLPVISVNDGTICSGTSFTMNPSGASTYTFSSGSAVVSPSINTTYSVTGTSSLGCVSASAAVSSVSVNVTPTVNATSSASLICNGQTATLTATGATTYSWNTTATTNIITVSPATTTSYTVTGITNGCSNTFSMSQAVSPCTGIDNKATTATGILVYPNPNTGKFTIELNNGSAKNIEVMDLTGKIVLSSSSDNSKVDLDINNLANGVYYVRIQSNNTVDVIKVVKQ